MSVFENDLQRLTFLKRTIALLTSMVDGGECHTARSKEMKNNAQQVILEMEANAVKTTSSNCNIKHVSNLFPSIISEFTKELKASCPDGINNNETANEIIIKSIEMLRKWVVRNNC